MQHNIATYNQDSISNPDLSGMFRLRHEVFAQRLGWEVQSSQSMERDAYDDLPQVSYVLAKAPDGRIDACWRMLPTIGPYMLRDTFGQLLHGLPAPEAADCWELSRFAVATDRTQAGHIGFGPLAMGLMSEAALFAKQHGIERYVTVTTPAIERMLKHQGLHIHRLGPPVRVGVAMALACMIEVDEVTLSAVEFF